MNIRLLSVWAWLHEQFQQVYIFTLLIMLYWYIIHVLAVSEFELKPEVESLLNQGSGGLISMMTLIVQSIFSKLRDAKSRAGDGPGASTPREALVSASQP